MQESKMGGPVARVFAAAATAVALSLAGIRGQTLGTIKNYRVAEPYESPHESQTKSLLEGAKARSLSNSVWLLTDVTVTTFRLTGEPDLIVNAPQCVFNQVSHAASSAGPLHAQMADGSFSIEGEGFFWQQTNSSLIISNRVHTTVHPKALAPETGKPAGAPTDKQVQPMEIFSRSFDYTNSSGLAVYRGGVQVVGTNLNITSQELTVDLPMADRQVRRITAERNVIIDYTNVTAVRATGEQAVYGTDTGLIRITGSPTWRADERQGRADELVIDQTNRIFEANGNAWLKMPGQKGGTFSFLSSSNVPAAGPSGGTNRSIEVWSRSYEFRTNWAVFRENVRLEDLSDNQVRGKMSCEWMKASFSGSNELQNLIATTNVVIEGDERRMTGGRAVYTGTNGWLELTERPAWKAGPREGHGDLVRVLTQGEEMLVRGNAFLRLPANELGSPQAAGAPATPKKATAPSVPQYAEINSREYTLRPEIARFEGTVRVKHPQMDWVCDHLTVRSLVENGKVLFAEGGVVFDLAGDKGQKVHGTGENVVYTNSVADSVTNDVIYLRGTPAWLETTNVVINNKLITLDRAKNLITAPGGDYKIKGTGRDTDTNMFRLPKSGVKK